MYLVRFFFFLGCLFFLGCKTTQNADQSAATSQTIPFEVVRQGNSSGIVEAQQLVISDASEWENLWQQIHANMEPTPALPTMNFNETQLIACFMGEQNTGGYEVSIKTITQAKQVLLAEVLYTGPGKNCFTTTVLTQPFVIVKLPKQTTDCRFQIDRKSKDC